MSQEDNILDRTSGDNEQKELKQEEKKSGGAGWISVLVSVFLIVRGFMWINDGLPTWGGIMILGGLAGLVWKLYDMSKNK